MQTASLAMDRASPAPSNRAVALWLYLCCAMVFLMVLIGGLTRLTESGLSIVEWQPLLGAVPPLTAQDWAEAFDKYKQFPEYQKLNAGMSLGEFQAIFWMEWTHRFWGRLIGLVFALPYAWFLIRGQMRGRLAWQGAAVLVLGGLQGAMGWYMVQSGLVDEPAVSAYRLTAHLGLALLVYGWMLWIAFGLAEPSRQARAYPVARPLGRWAGLIAALVFLQALAGGFVAGLDAGLSFNTFPLMNERWIPEGYLDLSPWWTNLFENHAAVQFNHRLLGMIVLAVVCWFWWRAQDADLPPAAQRAVLVVMFAAVMQVFVGIMTLVHVVPISLAVLHQAGALVLFAAALWAAHFLRDISGSAGTAR